MHRTDEGRLAEQCSCGWEEEAAAVHRRKRRSSLSAGWPSAACLCLITVASSFCSCCCCWLPLLFSVRPWPKPVSPAAFLRLNHNKRAAAASGPAHLLCAVPAFFYPTGPEKSQEWTNANAVIPPPLPGPFFSAGPIRCRCFFTQPKHLQQQPQTKRRNMEAKKRGKGKRGEEEEERKVKATSSPPPARRLLAFPLPSPSSCGCFSPFALPLGWPGSCLLLLAKHCR
jgi:hypothetical protein